MEVRSTEEIEERFAGGEGTREAITSETCMQRYSQRMEHGGAQILRANWTIFDVGSVLVSFAVNRAATDTTAPPGSQRNKRASAAGPDLCQGH